MFASAQKRWSRSTGGRRLLRNIEVLSGATLMGRRLRGSILDADRLVWAVESRAVAACTIAG
jgi:hypothetical protein